MADNITVRQLLDLAATDDLKLNLYDEVHQIDATCRESSLRSKAANPYDWGSATVTYWVPVSSTEINISCVLQDTLLLGLHAISIKLGNIIEDLSLIRDAAQCDSLNSLLDLLDAARDEAAGRANDDKCEQTWCIQSAVIWLRDDVTNLLHDTMIACNEEAIRELDASLCNILNIECIDVLKLIRDWTGRASTEINQTKEVHV
jgi:hypothetical protein